MFKFNSSDKPNWTKYQMMKLKKFNTKYKAEDKFINPNLNSDSINIKIEPPPENFSESDLRQNFKKSYAN